MPPSRSAFLYTVSRPGRRPCGFTLIELLVVVAIIALLLAILLPSLAAAREQSKSTVCKAHLSQIGIGYANYVADSGIAVRPGTYYTTKISNNLSITTYWNYGQKIDFSNPPATYDPYGGWISQSFKAPGMLQCPSLFGPPPSEPLTSQPKCAYSASGSLGSYGTGVLDHPTVDMASLTVIYADAVSLNTSVTPHTLDYPGSYIAAPSNSQPSFHGRHMGKGNVLWYDGHVSMETPFIQTLGLRYWSSQDVTKFNIGHITPVPMSTSQVNFLYNSPNMDYYFWADKNSQH